MSSMARRARAVDSPMSSPYANAVRRSSGSLPVKPTSRYRVLVGDDVHRVAVTDRDVELGRTLHIDEHGAISTPSRRPGSGNTLRTRNVSARPPPRLSRQRQPHSSRHRHPRVAPAMQTTPVASTMQTTSSRFKPNSVSTTAWAGWVTQIARAVSSTPTTS